ncbi:MAG: hypothetical protein MUE40_03285 [Anaerolineae bacterium]|nr:hypothetical protein [Anaerolineae bacterium]
MSVHPEWDNPEKTIIRHIFSGNWTIDEIRRSAAEAWQMMRTVEHPVHAILDMSQVNTLPSGGVLAQANRIATHRPPNAGAIVIVSRSEFIVSLANAFSSIYGRVHFNLRFKVVKTLDEARYFLQDVVL